MKPDIELGPFTVQMIADHRCLLCHRPAASGSWTCAECGERVAREAVRAAIREAWAEGRDEALEVRDEIEASRED